MLRVGRFLRLEASKIGATALERAEREVVFEVVIEDPVVVVVVEEVEEVVIICPV